LQPALAIELAYATEIERRHARLKYIVDKVLTPVRLEAITKKANIRLDYNEKYGDVRRALAERVRLDAPLSWDDDLDRALDLARATFNGLASDDDLVDLAARYARETNDFQRAQLQSTLSQAVGVNVFIDNSALLKRMGAHVKNNVDLITSIDEDYLADIRKRLYTSIRAGDRVENMRDMIEDRYEVSKGRAALIARDQTMKFYGELNRERQTDLGIDEYEWNGVMDNRERPTHMDLEGKRFKWGEPPVTNAQGDRNEPGGDYQCRCTATPVLPRF
jgi:SPP1 gp7 family putative phage head morphogenesis protein